MPRVTPVKDVKISFRAPATLHVALIAAAERERRSVSDLIMVTLADALAARAGAVAWARPIHYSADVADAVDKSRRKMSGGATHFGAGDKEYVCDFSKYAADGRPIFTIVEVTHNREDEIRIRSLPIARQNDLYTALRAYDALQKANAHIRESAQEAKPVAAKRIRKAGHS